MKDDFAGISFSIPYEIAVVRPLRQTTLRDREEALKRAYYNTELIPQELVYVDLKTDSGVSSLSTLQVAGMMGAEVLSAGLEMAPEANSAFNSLTQRFQEIFGYPFVVFCTQGRAAERIWAKMHIREGSVVPGNMLFPSTRFHIESNGARVIDAVCDEAYDLLSDDPFKGNVDIEKLAGALKEYGREAVSCIYVELCVNSCGGHPVSLGNLKEVKSLAEEQRVPLFLDASRILENSYFVKQREPGYQSRSIPEIIRETCSLADGCTMSALKDFSAPMGGFIGTRDEKSYQKAFFQSFLDGVQPSSAGLESLNASLREIFSSDQYAASRAEQVQYLWQRLVGWQPARGTFLPFDQVQYLRQRVSGQQRSMDEGVPVIHPPGGHGVFIDVKGFLPHVPAENYPAEALAAFIYTISGVRITKGPPLTQNQVARGIELLRLAVPARRYLLGHLDDVAEAVLYAYSHRDEIKGLSRIEKPGRSKYEPPLFAPEET